MKRYKFLDERKFRYLCQGLTLDKRDLAVLDSSLVGLDKINKLTSRIVSHNQKYGFSKSFVEVGPQIIVNLNKMYSPEKGPFVMAPVVKENSILDKAPSLHINLNSPSLDIPQRIEIPLRLVLKGLPKLEGTYMVYLHVLKMEDGVDYVYYGITKRGWMKRFNEHISSSLKNESNLLFHRTLREGVLGRLTQLYGESSAPGQSKEFVEKILIGNYHVVCGAGLSEENALETEEYLVNKYSFSHNNGLNMIPGGREGIAYLHKHNLLSKKKSILTDAEKDNILSKYLRENPRKGLPNLAISEHWNNPDYAAKVICGRTGRLTVEQVGVIREAALDGRSIEEIKKIINGKSNEQIRNVIRGKTYKRIE
ncbi:hypothetical protein Misp06_04327 [Microbulbifer sp. NBRC 101763]|uniref:hypothetical protein n=1 Tax=Microbulbifer sp. NBRC 101763 TaxID=1113820 RepID=UPI0030A1E458